MSGNLENVIVAKSATGPGCVLKTIRKTVDNYIIDL